MIATNSNRTQAPPPQAGTTEIKHGYLPYSAPTILPPTQTSLHFEEHLPLPLVLSAFLHQGQRIFRSLQLALSSPCWPADSRLSSLVSRRATSSGPSSGVLFMVPSYLPWRKAPQLSMICFLLSSPLNPQVSPCHFIFHCKPVPEQVSGTKLMLTKLTAWLSEQTRASWSNPHHSTSDTGTTGGLEGGHWPWHSGGATNHTQASPSPNPVHLTVYQCP